MYESSRTGTLLRSFLEMELPVSPGWLPAALREKTFTSAPISRLYVRPVLARGFPLAANWPTLVMVHHRAVLREEQAMSTYIMLADYTDQGIRNVKDSPARLDAAKELIRSLGGELQQF